MSSRIFNDEIYQKDVNYDNIDYILFKNYKITDLSILYKFKNLTYLYFNNCNFNSAEYLNFDFSKLEKLKCLELSNNYSSDLHLNIEDMKKYVSEKLNLDLDIVDKYYNLLNKSYFIKEYYIKNFPNEVIDNYDYDEIIKPFEEFELKTCLEKEKEFELIMINKTIYDCKLNDLEIGIINLKKFIDNLPDECNLIDNLHNLIIPSSTYTHTYLIRSLYSMKDWKDKYLYNIGNIEKDSNICKLALFPNLKTNIFNFMNNSDFDEYTAIDKCKKKKETELLPIDNVVLYYKNNCLVNLIYDKKINFLDIEITNLKIQVLDFDYAFNGFNTNTISCLNNLPNIENLILQLTREYHDNFNSVCESSYFIIDENLPITLKNLKITGCDKAMIKDIKKLPFGTKLEYSIYKNEYDDMEEEINESYNVDKI